MQPCPTKKLASRLAGIDAAYGALADLSFSVDDFLREKHEEMRREEERDQRYLKEAGREP